MTESQIQHVVHEALVQARDRPDACRKVNAAIKPIKGKIEGLNWERGYAAAIVVVGAHTRRILVHACWDWVPPEPVTDGTEISFEASMNY